MSDLEKIPALTRLVERVLRELAGAGVRTIDHWQGDLAAIGFERVGLRGRLVYVSISYQRDGQFWVECEESEEGFMGMLPAGRVVDYDGLIDAIENHLMIQSL